MEQIARVFIRVEDGDLKRWAREEERIVEEVISDLKNEFEEFIHNNSRKLAANMEFLEWEELKEER